MIARVRLPLARRPTSLTPKLTRRPQSTQCLSLCGGAQPCKKQRSPQLVSHLPLGKRCTHFQLPQQDVSHRTLNPYVTISLDGKEREFSAILLRDICQCPACVHEFTNQKLFSTADIPSNIQARDVSSSQNASDAIDILWGQDVPGYDSSHTTTLRLGDLRSIDDCGIVPSPFEAVIAPPVSWKKKSGNVQDFDYTEYMQSDSALFQVLIQLQTHGLVFITNVPGVERSVSDIAERIGPVKDTFYGHTWDVRTVPQAINAAYTSNDLGFHTDLLYFENPPHIQLLHCIQSSSAGGASVFSDAFQAAADLYEADFESFDTLATLPTNYQYKHPDSNLYRATKPVIDMRPLRVADHAFSTLPSFFQAWEQHRCAMKEFTTKEVPSLSVFDCLEKINWGPPFLAPFSLDQLYMEQARKYLSPRKTLNEKVDKWHFAAKKLNEFIHKPEILHERLMKPGECVLFNNTRVLHSRLAFHSEDTGKPRWLRGTYVDKDPFFSKLRVLSEKSRA